MSTFVCMCVSLQVYGSESAELCVNECTSFRGYVCLCGYVDVYVYVCMSVRVHLSVCVYVCLRAHQPE